MIDKPEYVNWANVWWILGAEHLTFEEVMGDFRKKDPADWFRGEKVCKDITGKNNTLYWKKKNAHGAHCYVSRKIFLTPEIWEKSSYPNKITHTPLLHKSHMVNHIGGGGRGGRDRALGLFWTNRGSEVSEETWGTSCILYGQLKYVFEREFLYCKFCKGFMDVFYIFTSAWKNTTKCAFEIDFLPCAQPI